MERSRAGRERRDGSPRPGDLYVFRETAAFDVQWAVLCRHPKGRRGIQVVPADDDPRVGSADVGVSARGICGALTLRCRFDVWLDEEAFDAELLTGVLAPEDLLRGIRKRDDIERGTLRASGLERETDGEPEYRDRWKQMARARRALAERSPVGSGWESEPPRRRGGSGDRDPNLLLPT